MLAAAAEMSSRGITPKGMDYFNFLWRILLKEAGLDSLNWDEQQARMAAEKAKTYSRLAPRRLRADFLTQAESVISQCVEDSDDE